MHPVLASRSNLLLYLAAWLPVVALLAVLLAYAGGFRWPESLLLAAPMAVFYAFLSLSSWYLCRAFPLAKSSYVLVLGIHTVAALLSSALWVLAGEGIAVVVSALPSSDRLGERLGAQVPLLFAVGVLLFYISVAVSYLLSEFERSREAEKRALESQVLARDADLRALRAQTSPHFLFNCLNSISALTTADPARARQMCHLLAGFLRRSLEAGGEEFIILEDEIALARDYLVIEQTRFGSRLSLETDVAPESRTCLVPSLLMQPLVENAVTHGIAQRIEGGTIRIASRVRDDQLRITVENPCDNAAPTRRQGGFGLDHLKTRLEAQYGREARLDARKDGERFSVEVVLPARSVGTHAIG